MRYLLTIILLFSGFASAQVKQTVSVYHYHTKPPLVINIQIKQGLYYDFTRYLNTRSTTHHFELVFVPRKRIERMLKDEKLQGILLGVNPVWFNDKKEVNYLWTEKIFTDRDEVVSLAETPIEFTTPDSLAGKVFGGVRGFYYYGISELVNRNKISHIETVKEVDLFYMLLNKRIDAAVISRSTLDYLVKKNNWQSIFHLSNKPHDIYERRVLVPKHLSPVFDELDTIVKKLPKDKNWLKILARYK
ncbi:hypothetical protein tinsulaeT_19960 [Thalassotalea insulae]|uniref:Solute-binding protein family 3/N-terminal domain-containing protein n=1 Tax=Thalassotalea insulae TaxID=2056778 RepID=A0ABQ6GRU8_9GAMM|nr:transporter substrate-binding domain-containing protein [Thalassotalea insulae]GLX78656.1 hypothetical protein tinsulaeT_19960 [Thalassotalea insulae]